MFKFCRLYRHPFAYLLCLIGLLLGVNSQAHQDHHHSEFMVHNVTINPTPPGINNSAAYFELINHGSIDSELISATSNIAERIEIHEHKMNDGVMRMQKVEGILIPANGSVQFQPGGYHLMFFNVNKTIKQGDRIEITLNFSDGQSLMVEAKAQEPETSGKENHHHHKH